MKLWFALRTDGVEPIRTMIRSHVELTQELAALVRADDRFEIVAPHPLNLLCIARTGDTVEQANEATDRLIGRANDSGTALFTRTVLDDRSVLRISIGARATERHHVMAMWELLRRLSDD